MTDDILPSPSLAVQAKGMEGKGARGAMGPMADAGKSRVIMEAPLLSRKQSARKILTAFYGDQMLLAGMQASIAGMCEAGTHACVSTPLQSVGGAPALEGACHPAGSCRYGASQAVL